ncbi:MAG: hypothetical protein NXI03_06740, partial [Alphaproteobacteria bacterium]|nr:hypothetical protein [Alphaproteobacteria bacterium]
DYINDAHKTDGTCDLTNDLINGGRNHDYPILPEEAKKFGCKIRTDMPDLVFGICQPPPKDDPVLVVSMFNSQQKEGEAPAPAPAPTNPPVFRLGFWLAADAAAPHPALRATLSRKGRGSFLQSPDVLLLPLREKQLCRLHF